MIYLPFLFYYYQLGSGDFAFSLIQTNQVNTAGHTIQSFVWKLKALLFVKIVDLTGIYFLSSDIKNAVAQISHLITFY
jgi:hypothetical protein